MDHEQIAREFHYAYERLAPLFGYATREDTKEFDPDLPNGKLMIAVVEELGIAQLKQERDALAEQLQQTQAENRRLEKIIQAKIISATHTAKQLEQSRQRERELREAGDELADLVDSIREGEYIPDSFTTQPMRQALKEK